VQQTSVDVGQAPKFELGFMMCTVLVLMSDNAVGDQRRGGAASDCIGLLDSSSSFLRWRLSKWAHIHEPQKLPAIGKATSPHDRDSTNPMEPIADPIADAITAVIMPQYPTPQIITKRRRPSLRMRLHRFPKYDMPCFCLTRWRSAAAEGRPLERLVSQIHGTTLEEGPTNQA